jgi:hypothetical protein
MLFENKEHILPFLVHLKGEVFGAYFQMNHRKCLFGYTPVYIEVWHVMEYPSSVIILRFVSKVSRNGMYSKLSGFKPSIKTVSTGII